MNESQLAANNEDDDDWAVSPLVRSIVLNAKVFLAACLSFGIVLFMSLLLKGSAVLHLDKVDFVSIFLVLNLFSLGFIFVATVAKRTKAARSPKVIMRAVPFIFLLNTLISSSSAGFLLGEMQSSNWKTSIGKVLSVSNKEVHQKGGRVIYYPLLTMQYKANGRELQATVLSETTDANVTDGKVIVYYNPVRPTEVSLSRGLLESHQIFLYSTILSILAGIASGIYLLIWQSRLVERLRSVHLKGIGQKHEARAIAADATATHIHLYDPIPGTEHHEIILNERKQPE